MKQETHTKPEPKPETAPAEQPLNGKTVESLTTTKVASMHLVDIALTDKTHFYVKFMQGVEEIGGTAEWGTGRQL